MSLHHRKKFRSLVRKNKAVKASKALVQITHGVGQAAHIEVHTDRSVNKCQK